MGRALGLSKGLLRSWNIARDEVVILGGVPQITDLPEGGTSCSWEEWLRHVHPDDRGDYEARMQACQVRGDSYDLSYRLGRGETAASVRERGVVYQDRHGRPMEVVSLILDVTEQGRLENRLALARKMEAFGQLAGGVAHDFNNMLSIILGYTQILLDDLPGEDAKRPFLREIDDAARRAASLTNQLLAFTRQEIYEKQKIGFDHLLAEMGKMLRRMVGEQVQLTVEPAAGVDAQVIADRNQLEQLLIHLSVCARELLPTGGFFTFRSRVFQPDPEKKPVLVLEAECRESTLNSGGCSPGAIVPWPADLVALATCRSIVAENHGSLTPADHPAAPEVLVVELPMARRKAAAESKETRDLPLTRGRKILLVEDDPGVRTLGRVVFSRAGYEVIEAANGQAGLRAFQSCRDERLAIVVTDVIMPALNGIEMARQILVEDPEVPILFLSGYPDQISRLADPPLTGRHSLLRKPCPISEIFQKVQEMIQETTAE